MARKLTRAEKRKQIRRKLNKSPAMSDRAVAKLFKVSPTTVGVVRQELEAKTGQMHTHKSAWQEHPYYIENKHLLTNLSVKSQRALRAPGVIQKMAEKNSLSPRYCQRLLYKERQIEKSIKRDEFYTLYDDIDLELDNHRDYFEGKVVYCNCDDPTESNFVKYFIDNFEPLGLKRLIATHYIDPAISDTKPQQLTLQQTAEGFIRSLTPLTGDGDFRSPEAVALLQTADVVVTNPPFSLFREFIEQMAAYDKQFLVLGTVQAVNYTPILDGIIADRIRVGYTNYNRPLTFFVPHHYKGKEDNGDTYAEVHGICWWTTLPVNNKRLLPLKEFYSPSVYPKYEAKNTKGKYDPAYPRYDAINVDRTEYIPQDYWGYIGVPITALGLIDLNKWQVIDKINNAYIGIHKVYARLIIKRKQ